MDRASSGGSSGSDQRRPCNAQGSQGGGGEGSRAVPQGIRQPSMARATDRLASLPSSLPRSWQLQHQETQPGASSNGEESDASGSGRGGGTIALDGAAIARRVKRHLVMHGGEAGSMRGSVGAQMAGEVPAGVEEDEDEDGYAGDDNDDEQDDERVVADPLTLPSGDMMYGLYRWHEARGREEDGPRRRGSFSGVASDTEWGVPYSQRQLTMPGGFRRQFLQDQAAREGRPPVGMLATSFVDFIGLYGHFAGSDYPSDEDEPPAAAARPSSPQQSRTENTPLLQQQQQQREAERSIHATASSRKAFFLLLKAFVGTGVLVLPKAFANGGLLASVAVVAAVAWYAWHCMILLGEVFLAMGGSYSGLGTRLLGPWAGRAITVSIVVAQLGFCSAYTIFVATNARSVWDALTGCRYRLSPTFWVLAQLVAYVPLAWVRRIKQFAPFALVANACIMAGLAYVLAYDIGRVWSAGIADIVQYNPLRFPLLVGTAVFAFEGVTLVIPVVDSMTHPHQFPRVLTAVMAVCLVVFCGIAALSYMAFGESVETVVLLSLPPNAPTVAVQLLYSLAIMLSVPLQLFPAVRILEAGIFPSSGKGDPLVKWQKNLFRGLLTLLVAALAIFGAEQLDNFIAIIGAFSCTPLSFIYPTLLHHRISAGCRWTRIKDLALAAVGVVILVYVTYMGIVSWGASPPPADRCVVPPPL